MKKLLALLAVVLCVVSCQTEPEGLDVNVGGEIDAIVNVTIPEVETRATNSAEGAFKNVDFSKYTIRYILQVYYNNEPSQERLVKYSDDKSVAFDVRLVPGRDYNFVVWADIVADSNYADNQWSNDDGLHYNTTDLHNITLKQTWVAMDETRDAFTATVAVNGYSSASNITVNLKRPFAKLRVVTTDMVALNNLDIVPTTATVTYSVDHYNAFNALLGNAIGDSKNRTIKHENYEIASYRENVAEGADMTLFTDYFFAENDVVKFNFDVYDQNGDLIKSNAFNTDINVKRNYLTTIKGNILTDGNNFNVTIDDAFAGNENWPDNNAEQLAYAAMFGGVVELDGDIDLTNTASNIVFINDATIKLNGHTIKAGKWETGAFDISALVVDKGATLTIEGEGTIQGSQYGIYAYDGNLTIKGGNIKANSSAVQIREGNLNIEGGVFSVTNSGNDTRYVINCIDRFYQNGSANVNITGGVFNGFNPGNNAAEGANTNFVAAGYKVIEKDGKYVVVPEDVDNVVASTEDVKNALEDAATAGETEVVIDANGANIGNLNYGLSTALVPAGTTVTIRNANIEGRSYGNGVNGTVIFEGCTFNNSGAYSIHFDNGAGDVIFKNCKLYGWNSFGSTLNSVSFENCTLDGNGTYALIRSYVTLTLTNCVINTSNANHTDAYSEGVEAIAPATLTENNVTYVADNADSLENALEAGAENVFVAAGSYTFPTAGFTANTVLTCEEGTVFEGNTKLNINGATVVGATFSNPSGTAVDQSINGTFKDCTFSGSNALRWCYAGETCVFENCVFDGEVYGVHFDGGANEVTFKNCVFSGFNAFGAAITQLNLEGCTFVGNGKSGYNGANLWGSTKMVNCEFTFNGTTAYEWIDCIDVNKAYEFVNCTVNGIELTSSNYTNYEDNIFSSNHATVKINGTDYAM